MKIRMILAALLLPAVVMAQQPGEKPQSTPPGNANVPNYNITNSLTNPHFQYLVASAPQSNEQSKVRVNLNLRNAPLKEAIKQLTEQTKLEFVLESDAPADARITIVAKNIRLNTALDMLTDATEINWNQQAVNKVDAKSVSIVYHLGKKVSRNWWEQVGFSPYINTAVPVDANGNLYWNVQDNNRWNYLFNRQDGITTQKIKVTPSPKGSQNSDIQKLYVTPSQKGSQNSDTATNLPGVSPYTNQNRIGTIFGQGQPLNLSTSYSANTLASVFDTTEVRSTFTCPHCKNQVTVIHKHEAPKCDKCGRVFHDDWQFCPFDGAKRPAGTDTDWQFCPICGERIKPDAKADTKPKEAKADTNRGKGAGVGN